MCHLVSCGCHLVCHKSRVIDVSKCVTIMCGCGVIVVRYQYFFLLFSY